MKKRIYKICNTCGGTWSAIPPHAKTQDVGDLMDGHYWQCLCGSTLFIRLCLHEAAGCCTCPSCIFAEPDGHCHHDCDPSDQCQGCREADQERQDMEYEKRIGSGR